MQIERGTLNTLLVNARPTLTPSRWLLWFRDPERNASVYCLCSALVAGSPTLIRFKETDTPTALNGQVKLSPPGNWTLKIYEQSSTTNLNPANATRLVEERAVFVVGAVEPESGWSGTECPPGSGDDCEEGTVVLVDSEGTELDSVTVASAGEASITAPDVTVRQTDGNTGITVGSAPAGGTYLLPETVIRYNDGSGVVTTQTYNTLGSDPNITPDVTVPARALKDSDDNPIGSTVITLADLLDNTVPNCPACDEVTLCGLITDATSEEVAICVISSGKRPGVLAEIIPTVPEGDTVAQVYDVMTPAQQDLFDVTVQLQDTAGTNIGSADVYPAGTITTKTAPDGTVLRDGAPYGFVKSNGSIDVPSNIPAGDPIIYAFGPELWSGQSSSFRTGDEQSIRAAGWFDYTPSFGSSSQKQYLVNWLTLGVNNHFGNTNRFTDATGAAYGTTGDRTFIDHLTKLQWFVPNDPTLTAVWNTAIDAALASSADGHTDWKVPPIQVWYSVALYNSGSVLNYGPFNIATAIIPWSSTTSPASTAQALRMTNALGAASATNKTSATQHGIFVRRWAP